MNRFIVPLVLVALTSPTFADWQYTRWGMTPAQVQTASKGSLKLCDTYSCKGQTTDTSAAQLVGDYRSGEFTFKAFAMFEKKTNKLVQINLTLTNPENAASLVGAVRSKYGEPASQSRSAIMNLFVWRERSDQISIAEIGRGPNAAVTLGYQPRATESNKGL